MRSSVRRLEIRPLFSLCYSSGERGGHVALMSKMGLMDCSAVGLYRDSREIGKDVNKDMSSRALLLARVVLLTMSYVL